MRCRPTRALRVSRGGAVVQALDEARQQQAVLDPLEEGGRCLVLQPQQHLRQRTSSSLLTFGSLHALSC